MYVCVEESVYAKVLMRQLDLWCTQKQNNPVEPEVASHSNKIRNVEYVLIQYLQAIRWNYSQLIFVAMLIKY